MAIDLGPDGLTLGSTTVNDWAGKILQVKSTQSSSTGSVSLGVGSWTTWPSLSVSITPASTSSKILVMFVGWGEYSANPQDTTFRVLRGSTGIPSLDSGSRHGGLATPLLSYFGDTDSTAECAMFNYIDSPSTTSATTYQVQARAGSTGKTLYYNRTVTDANSRDYERFMSTLILMEIAG